MKTFLQTKSDYESSQPPLWSVVLITVALPTVITFAYEVLNWRNNQMLANGHALFKFPTALDAYIPFIPESAFFYYAYYFILLYIAITAYTNKLRFRQAVTGIFFLTFASIASWTVVPSQMIRPDVSSCIDFACALVKGMYEFDPGYNIMPSMHTGHSVFVMMLAWHYNRKQFAFIAPVAMGVIASTVLMKQHYLADLPPGVALGMLGFYVGDRFGVQIYERATSAFSILRRSA